MATRRQYSFPTSSQLERIVKCPASFWGDHNHFGQPLPEPHPALTKEGNTAADTGTKLHACIEAGFIRPSSNGRYGAWNPVLSMDKAFELDVSDAFQDCLPGIEETFRQIGATKNQDGLWYPYKDGGFFRETALGLSKSGMTIDPLRHDPYMHDQTALAGRVDLLTFNRSPINGTACVVLDWKFGAHPVEDPATNLQLISLAVMAFSMLDPSRSNYDSSFVQLVISYPSSSEIEMNTMSMTKAVDIFRKKIEPILDPVLVKSTPHRIDIPGDHCVYCPRKAHCWSTAERGIRIAQHIKAAL